MSSRILVVDDERASRRSLVTILEMQGYTVESAASGEEALERINLDVGAHGMRPDSPPTEFDLALLDLKLPGMDGLAVMQALRRRYPEMQVVLLTGHGSLQSAIQALQLGVNDYLLKPCSPKQILESVRKCLQERQQRQEQRRLISDLEKSAQAMRQFMESSAASAGPPDVGAHGMRPDSLDVGAHGMRPAAGIRKNLGERGAAAGQRGVSNRHLQVDTKPLGLNLIALNAETFYDVMRREVRQGSKRLRLTRSEGRLIRALAEQPGRLLSHQQLANAVQGYAVASSDAAAILRPLVSRLRRKLAGLEGGAHWIVSVRTTGYLLEAENPTPE